MLSKRSQFAFLLAVAGLLWLPAGSRAENPQVQEPTTAVAPPGPAAALAKVPPGQAVVTYQNGELTIKARNAPLIDVLRAVCSQTGAVLDSPSGADDRMSAILGPGPVSEVVGALLNDSLFDYAMAGSAEALTRLIVFPSTRRSNAENSVPPPQVDSTTAASVGETQAGAASPAGAGSDSQRVDGRALDANAVGRGASSPQVTQPAGAAGSDTAGADPGGPRPSAARHRHRRR